MSSRERHFFTRLAFLKRMMGGMSLRTPLVLLVLLGGIAACTPKVAVEPPKEPITINLNIQADVRVRIEEAAETDISENPDIFGAE